MDDQASPYPDEESDTLPEEIDLQETEEPEAEVDNSEITLLIEQNARYCQTFSVSKLILIISVAKLPNDNPI